MLLKKSRFQLVVDGVNNLDVMFLFHFDSKKEHKRRDIDATLQNTVYWGDISIPLFRIVMGDFGEDR